jgi:hypothetical protein
MLTRIKKTPLSLQIESGLLQQVKLIAKQKGISLRQIIEHYLKQFVEDEKNEKNTQTKLSL